MNTTSFQSSTYNHSLQGQIQGQSGLKLFGGQDLTSGDRKRLQQLQSQIWWRQQAEEKQRRNKMQQLEKQTFDQQTLQITQYRNQLEQEKAKRLHDMEVAHRQANLQQLQQKLNREAFHKKLEDEDRSNHINYLQGHDVYTQNAETCQSALGRNRVLPYHWKGMSEDQRNQILDEQQKQRQQKLLQNDLEKQEDRLFAQQVQAQRKAIVIQDRAKNKGNQNVRKGVDEYNKLKAQQMKKKAYNAYNFTQTYKNQ